MSVIILLFLLSCVILRYLFYLLVFDMMCSLTSITNNVKFILSFNRLPQQ